MEIKITRKLLDNYRKTKKEIPLLEQELQEMKKGDNGFGNSTIFDYQTGFPRPQSVVGFDWPLYESRTKELNRKRSEVMAVEKWINFIEDGQTRCVFRMFYIDGMSWQKVAKKIGIPQNEDYPRVCIRDAYLKKKGIR